MIKRNKRRLVPSLNTTSTADISFMLLIFFLVTTSMDLDKGLRRVLPPVDNQQQQQETNIDKDKLMAITITDADSEYVEGKPYEQNTQRTQVRDYLAREGYHIIDRNWRSGHKELDIVCERDGVLVIVEVKTRRDARFGKPEDAVSENKIRRIVLAADAYVRRNRIDLPVRFDIITVLGKNRQLNHIIAAFRSPVWYR